MANTYRTIANLLTLLPDNTTGAISAQTDRDFLISTGDMAGGFESVRQKYGLTGTDSTADWSKIASALNSSSQALWPRFAPALNTAGKTLTQELYWDGLYIVGPSAGADMPSLNANNPASGAVVFTPGNQAIYMKNLRFMQGKVWFDLGALTTECPVMWYENLWASNVNVFLRDGSIANGLTRKVDKLIFRNNLLDTNVRGLFINGNGSSRAWIQNNHVKNCTRFGIMNACATPQPGNNGNSDFMFIHNNLVEGLSYDGANSNGIYSGGRYATIIGNIVANAVFNGVATQTNWEPYYNKTQGCILMGNMSVDGGAGQGMFALKGIGRANSDNSPPGYDFVLVGNVGISTDADQYQENGIWLQTQDANCAHNVFDGIKGYGAHVNKNTGDVSQRSYNLTVTDNHFKHKFGSGMVAEGGHTNIWVCRNIYTGLGGSGQSLGVRFDSQNLGDMVNYRCQDNTIHLMNVTAAARFDCIHLKPQGTDTLLGCLVIGNVMDLAACPDITNVFGVTIEGTGPVVNLVIDKNQFLNFTDPTKVIRCITGGKTGFINIYDNIGFANDNTGTATIPVGSASVTISHGMPQTPHLDPTPDLSDIRIISSSFLFGASQARIANITATTFDVVLDVAVTGSDWSFKWRVRKTKWSFN